MWAIGHESSCLDEFFFGEHPWEAVPLRQRCNVCALAPQECVGERENGPCAAPYRPTESSLNILGVSCFKRLAMDAERLRRCLGVHEGRPIDIRTRIPQDRQPF